MPVDIRDSSAKCTLYGAQGVITYVHILNGGAREVPYSTFIRRRQNSGFYRRFLRPVSDRVLINRASKDEHCIK